MCHFHLSLLTKIVRELQKSLPDSRGARNAGGREAQMECLVRPLPLLQVETKIPTTFSSPDLENRHHWGKVTNPHNVA